MTAFGRPELDASRGSVSSVAGERGGRCGVAVGAEGWVATLAVLA
jgi:hypothetical protein